MSLDESPLVEIIAFVDSIKKGCVFSTDSGLLETVKEEVGKMTPSGKVGTDGEFILRYGKSKHRTSGFSSLP